MNYEKHYDALIAKRGLSIKPSEGYYERHHIVPRSMGGSNDKSNLVYLTAREHFIAHKLLYKIHPNNWNMVNAYHSFCMIPPRSNRKIKFTSHDFKSLREASSKKMRGDNNPTKRPEVAAKISEKMRGDNNPTKRPEVAAKISEKNLGKNSGCFKGIVIAESLDGKVVIEMEGSADIRSYGFHKGHVYQCINGRRNTHKGFTFRRLPV